MLGDLPACSGFGVGSMIRRHGPRFPFEKCHAAFKGSDLVIGNIEVVLSRFDARNDEFASTHLRAQPEAVGGLVWAGVNAVTLANNHIMQHGREAVVETMDILRKNKIAFTGIEDESLGVKNFARLDKKGVRIGMLGYNFRPEQYKNAPRMDVAGSRERILNDIEEVRSTVDVLLLSLHWGEEFIQRPSGEQVRLGRNLIDAGAHVILGHHPHILQGVEKFRGRIIAYSLGDFIFDLWHERLRDSMILRLSLEDPNDIRHEIVPVLINKKWQPVVLEGAAAETERKRIDTLTARIDADADAAAWNDEVRRELQEFRHSVRNHYIANVFRYNPRRLFANALGIVTRRLVNRG